MTIFVGTLFSHVLKNKRSKMHPTKIVTADLDSPRRELSNGGLGIVVALLVRPGIDFLSALPLTLNPAVSNDTSCLYLPRNLGYVVRFRKPNTKTLVTMIPRYVA